MEDTKPWYASRNIWASILQVAVGISITLGLFNQEVGAGIIAQGPDLLAGLAVSVIGIVQIATRALATHKIGS